MTTAATLRPYLTLTRLDRPIGILLLLWPTWWALWLAADGWPPVHLLVIFTLGVILTRAAGCVVNDLFDRDFDRHVKRTAQRPLANGTISPRRALAVAMALGVTCLVLVLFTNRLTIMLAVAGAVIAISYPLFKRFSYLPQVWLGIAFGWGIPMAYAAVGNSLPMDAWLLLVANIFWAVAYDTYYAMVDRDDDLHIGVRSSAILFGHADLCIIALLQASMLLTMALVGWRAGLGAWYYLGLTGAAAGAAWQLYGARSRQREACFRAFLHNNWVGAAIFAGLVLNDTLGSHG